MPEAHRRETMRGTPERRAFRIRGFEWRAKDDGTGGEVLNFTGYASTTETPYDMYDYWGDPFSEVIAAGAFKRSLANPELDVPLLYGHSTTGTFTLARTKPGTMRLAEDDTGLLVDADLDGRRSDVRDIALAIERGDLDEMSFAFCALNQQWSPDYMERRITEVDIHRGDVSLVVFGANPTTEASMRSAALESGFAKLPADEQRAMVERLSRRYAGETTPAAGLPAQRHPLSLYAAEHSHSA